MWAYRLALSLGDPLRLHERLVVGEETDPALRRLVAEGYFRRGCVLRDRGRLDQALAVLQRGALVDPQHPALHAAVGAIFLRLERDQAAVSWLERAVELDARQAEWHALLARAFERTGRTTEALRHYEAALRLDPAAGAVQEGVQRLQERQRQQTDLAAQLPWWQQPWQPARSDRP
ncbi:MAG: tetratricopeptide repeat protein [Chloroflexi bacterium]|nr:tetratricopeptide repeat protein [Chloroflexota bacterium]